MKIWFDMDGTIANLYGVEGWLDYLNNEDTTPYAIAKPLVNFSLLARLLNEVQAKGIEIGVISWTSKGGSENYNARVAEVKKAYLAEHLPSVRFDSIEIVAYGTPKQMFANPCDILFDDELPNRENWTGKAYDEKNIFKIMLDILHNMC